jgi:hypothetical protein
MNIKNRQDFLVILVIAAAGLFVGINFIFTPLAHFWSDRQSQIVSLRDKVRDGTRRILREAITRGEWDQMRTNALPPVTSQAEQQFLKAMDGWSRDSGAEITSLAPQWKSDSTNYMTLECRVESEGDLGSLSRLIYLIEKGPMAVRLDTVELSSHDNSGQAMTLGMEVNGLALLQTDKK